MIRAQVLPSESFALVVSLLDRRVLATFTAGPEPAKGISRLTEQFNADAAILTDALGRLPDDLTLDQAATGSPERLAGWAVARDATNALDQHRRHRTWLAVWGIYRSGDLESRIEQASRCATFTDPAAVAPILSARKVLTFGVWPSIA